MSTEITIANAGRWRIFANMSHRPLQKQPLMGALEFKKQPLMDAIEIKSSQDIID